MPAELKGGSGTEMAGQEIEFFAAMPVQPARPIRTYLALSSAPGLDEQTELRLVDGFLAARRADGSLPAGAPTLVVIEYEGVENGGPGRRHTAVVDNAPGLAGQAEEIAWHLVRIQGEELLAMQVGLYSGAAPYGPRP